MSFDGELWVSEKRWQSLSPESKNTWYDRRREWVENLPDSPQKEKYMKFVAKTNHYPPQTKTTPQQALEYLNEWQDLRKEFPPPIQKNPYLLPTLKINTFQVYVRVVSYHVNETLPLLPLRLQLPAVASEFVPAVLASSRVCLAATGSWAS